MEKVKSLAHLKKLAAKKDGEREHFFIVVSGGAGRSSKQINYDPETKLFSVVNEIDFSFQDDLTEKQLREETFIVDAIEVGSLYKY